MRDEKYMNNNNKENKFRRGTKRKKRKQIKDTESAKQYDNTQTLTPIYVVGQGGGNNNII